MESMHKNNAIVGRINLSQTVGHAVYFILLQSIISPFETENNSLKTNVSNETMCQTKGKYKAAHEFE